jgi:2-polyprenyl-3-methyl-5-hydroxy-6-metoxy-1,4-benzoquinol methylase
MNRLLERHARDRSSCLDLGTGSGAFLPTLSRHFAEVVAVDQNVSDAANVVAAHGLANVTLRQCDVLAEPPFGRGQFKAIVAADVLEHFPETESIAGRLLDWLADDGVLVTSLPTESWIYVLLRKVFGVEKPTDHYFSGAEVEATLTRTGFTALRRCFVPFGIRTTSLFLVTAWRRTGT